jgi:4-diphosphocytidyl-2C-methyl-D-erythritol kinase
MVFAVRFLCPAKINLDLRVGPLAADGFHPLRSWVTTVGLFDTLDVFPDPTGGLSLSCSDPALPTDASNLVMRAAMAVQRHAAPATGGFPPGATMHLLKRIPAGGGLGGGSSDAATALRALATLWGVDPAHAALTDIAASLGSDVPFFLGPASSLCTGRGEAVRPLPSPRSRWALLILPPIAMPTPAVYRAFDRLIEGRDRQADQQAGATGAWREPFDDRLCTLRASELLPRLVNDLEPAAFALRPDLAAMRQRAEEVIARPVRMSGSGSTLFSVFDAEDEARAAGGGIGECLNTYPGLAVQIVPLAPAEV